jgi:hypothetical protein
MTDSRKNIQTWLFNPHYFIAGWKALFIGLSFILAAGYVGSLSGAQFDGLLDIHNLTPAPLATALEEGFLDWFVFAVLIYVGGRMISTSRIRISDVLGTQAVARFPTLISVSVLLVTKPGVIRFSQNPNHFGASMQDVAAFWATMVVILIMLVWMLRLMIQAFTVSCNVDVKSGKGKWVFWGAVILGEIITKEAFFKIFHVS